VDQRLLLMHQVMLADRARLEAYDKAMAARLRPGDTVIDVGAGTLILSMMALAHGAGHVYAIEAEPELAELGMRLTVANGVTDRLTVIQADARMGNLGPEEEMAEVIGTVRRRNLRPGGQVIPGRLTTALTPIQFDGEGWGVWDQEFYGYRFDTVCEHADPGAQLHFFARPPTLLSEPVPIADDNLSNGTSTAPRQAVAKISRAGRLHAVMGAFVADLGAGVEIANFPSRPGANWAVWIWPLRHVSVQAGDQLRVAVSRPLAGLRASVRDYANWRLDCTLTRGAERQPAARAKAG